VVGGVFGGILVLILLDWLTTPAKFSVKGKKVLITGGSSGIGRATALQLAQQGAHVTILARTESKLKDTVRELEDAGVSLEQRFDFVAADVTDSEALAEALSDHLRSHWDADGPDLLITSAGQSFPQYFDQIEISRFRELMEVNYIGIVNTVKAVLPFMKKRRGRKIVFISSMAGQVGVFGFTAYCPTKFALRGLAESLYHELLPYDISVALSYPPDTETPMFAEENKTKPLETIKIAGSGGLMSAEKVAATLIGGIVNNDFHITHNFEGKMLGIMTLGMSPGTTVFSTILEVLLLPILRISAIVSQFMWKRTIRKVHRERDSGKEKEKSE